MDCGAIHYIGREIANAAGKKISAEIESVSGEGDELASGGWEDGCDFCGVKFRYAKDEEVRKYGGKGSPCLVLLDRDGKILSDS